MKRFYTLLMFLVLALALAVPVQAQEELEMPPVLLEQIGLDPACTVIEATQVWSTETCTLNCGDIHYKTAAVMYKRRMSDNGFRKGTLGGHDGGARSTAEKNGATAVVQANKVDGYTQVVLSIDNIEALGGTPVDPDAPAEEMQGAEAMTDEQAAPEAPMELQPEPDAVSGPVTEEGAGLSAEIWDMVQIRSGDTLVEEFMTNGNPGCEVASSATTDQILDYYANALVAGGWMNVGRHVEADGGMVTLFKGEDTFIVAVDVDVASGTEYTLMLNKGQ